MKTARMKMTKMTNKSFKSERSDANMSIVSEISSISNALMPRKKTKRPEIFNMNRLHIFHVQFTIFINCKYSFVRVIGKSKSKIHFST